MHIRTLALLFVLLPAVAPAQERLVLASATAAAPPSPRVVPGGAIRIGQLPGTTPGVWLDF
jgi:hypothetical protein